MILNCGDRFNEFHLDRYRKMPVSELLKEYDAVEQALELDNADSLFCIDELIVWEYLIAFRCVELVREKLLVL